MAFKARAPHGYACKVGIYSAILLLLVSCAVGGPSSFETGDGGFLTGDPCNPPCFWGIIPGQTTEVDVMEILQEIGVHKSCETWDRRSDGGRRGIRCEGFVIDFDDNDIVRGIAFAPSLEISAQEVITKHGVPTWIATYHLGVHVLTFHIGIAYPQICTIVTFPGQNKLPYILEPSTSVKSISYDVAYCNSTYYEASPYWQQLWRGFGEHWPYYYSNQ